MINFNYSIYNKPSSNVRFFCFLGANGLGVLGFRVPAIHYNHFFCCLREPQATKEMIFITIRAI